MKKPKAFHLSVTGGGKASNEDYALNHQEFGIHLVCDGGRATDQGILPAEFVGQGLQEELARFQRKLDSEGPFSPESARLLWMQEFMLKAFANVQTSFSLMDGTSVSEGVSCGALWLDSQFAILAQSGNCRSFLYRGGTVHSLNQKRQEGGLTRLPAFGREFSAPELIQIEFQPGDLILMMTDGAYSSLDQSSLGTLVRHLIEGGDVGSDLSRCAHSASDDATLLSVYFSKGESYGLLSASERLDLVSKAPLTTYMDFRQKNQMAALCNVEEFEAGTILIQEGTLGEAMYMVAQGTLEVLINGQFIAYKKPGEFFGEVWLIKEGRRTATVVTKEKVVALSLQRSDLTRVFQEDMELEKNFYRGMLELVFDRLVEQGREIAQMKRL
ncbi:MAG: hypothetical protein EBX52_01950 [Proteobacteria bacterium]|nr:hypothetical protein [Pseudomonadota bacterium]